MNKRLSKRSTIIIALLAIAVIYLPSCGGGSVISENPAIETPMPEVYSENEDSQEFEPGEEQEEMEISASPEMLQYNSLEELLSDLEKLRAGEASEELVEISERLDLSSLEVLYVPSGLPENYKLFNIAISMENVSILFMPEEHLSTIATQMDAVISQQHFAFNFTRMSFEDPLAGVMKQFSVSEDDLIEGVILLDPPNSITWGYDAKMMHMYLPFPPDSAIEDRMSRSLESVLESLGLSDKSDLVRYTEVAVTNIYE